MRSVLGTLGCLARECRPDLSGPVSILQRRLSRAQVSDTQETNKVVRLAKAHTLTMPVCRIPVDQVCLVSYGDASGGSIHTEQAQTGHIVMFAVFSSFCGNGSSFCVFSLVARQSCGAGIDTYPLLYIPIRFYRIDIREDANTHMAILCKYLSKKYLHGCRRMTPGLLLPLTLLVIDILLPRVIDGSESVAAFGVGFCARSLLSYRKLHWSPFEHWPFSLH